MIMDNQWNRSRVSASAPDQIDTESNMMLLEAKARHRKRPYQFGQRAVILVGLDVEQMSLEAAPASRSRQMAAGRRSIAT